MKDPKRMKRLMEDAFRKVDIDGINFPPEELNRLKDHYKEIKFSGDICL